MAVQSCAKPLTCCLLAFLFAQVISFTSISFAEEAPLPKIVRFNEHIRPILSNRCFACHGPDDMHREADFRLDVRESATKVTDGKAPIMPSKPELSLILHRIASKDPTEVMPPPEAKKPAVTEHEAALLKKWIEQGAPYEPHWSFAAIQNPPVPKIEPTANHLLENPIDRFIVQKLRERGVPGLSPRASKEHILRRVTLDLTGLPPTIAELDAFLTDDSPSAYEKVVDRLLASPRYGERMATEWLDLARYADTHGFSPDQSRPTWAYRDWVIKAFNENLPYDQFALWQIAGDLLPNATKEQRLATAFNRLHCQNNEGGIIGEEFRIAYINDRVNTFGTAFLGLTFECSRCHDHKFDPLTQRDYYSMAAFFQNIDEAGQISFFTPSLPTPTMLLTTDEQDREIATLDKDIAAQEATVRNFRKLSLVQKAVFDAWLANRPAKLDIPGCIGSFDFDSQQKNKVTNSVDPKHAGNLFEDPQFVEGKNGKALSLDGENGVKFPGLANFDRSTPFSHSIWIKAPKPSARSVILHQSQAALDAASRGYDVILEDNRVAFGLYHFWPGNAVKVRTKSVVSAHEWSHIAVTYDGSSRASGLKIFVNGELAETETIADVLYKDFTYDGKGNKDLVIGQRMRDNGFKDGQVDDYKVFERQLTPLEVEHLAGRESAVKTLATPKSELTKKQLRQLQQYYLATLDHDYQAALEELQKLRDKQRAMINPIPEAMVMKELETPKLAYLLKRGAYDQPDTEHSLTANTPVSLPAFPKDQPRNRLGLASWLLDPSNPLFGRVTANRYWQTFFARGLVDTSDNFGSQGSTPTHPELLDWLAQDFAVKKWDIKAFVKQIMMSETYCQSSRETPLLKEKDPDNILLSRAPTRRLTAEMLRDQALYTSGLMSEKIGGEPVFPYQPAGIWDIATGQPHYHQSKGKNLYRRSIYTFIKRTVPAPTMMTLDAADRSYCTSKRQSTTTPLQSLVLLNDPQFVEAARFQAERMLREGGKNSAEQLAWLFRLVVGRTGTEKELAIIANLFEKQKAVFAADQSSAESILGVGEKKPDKTLNASEVAAATVVAQLLQNFDEVVQRR